jgi:hypothetical protein
METINTWERFAQITIATNDLDPMYEMLFKARAVHGDDWVKRYCMHFLMFYHAGEAALAADEKWTWAQYEYEFATLLRGTERRHFRGTQGGNCMKRLSEASQSPQDAFENMVAPSYTALTQLFLRGRFKGCGFGEYFMWKVLDLQTRVFDHSITLSLEEASKYLPNEPVAAAGTLFPHLTLRETLSMVEEEIDRYPLNYRVGHCTLQEAETVLCMLKGAFMTRTHQVGDDIADKRRALADYPELQAMLPPDCMGKYVLGELCNGNLMGISSLESNG